MHTAECGCMKVGSRSADAARISGLVRTGRAWACRPDDDPANGLMHKRY
jgi:hypothetical protein